MQCQDVQTSVIKNRVILKTCNILYKSESRSNTYFKKIIFTYFTKRDSQKTFHSLAFSNCARDPQHSHCFTPLQWYLMSLYTPRHLITDISWWPTKIVGMKSSNKLITILERYQNHTFVVCLYLYNCWQQL